MQVRVGIFVVPDATDPASTVGQILAADETGLDSLAPPAPGPIK
jgi:hypothetical protein